MKVIMISGKSGSGKDQTAAFIANELNQNNKRALVIHFGDLVKYFAGMYMGYEGKKDEFDRSLLQKLGTEIVRKKFPNYWAEIVAKFISAIEDDYDYAIIPDLRFMNEFLTVKKYNKNVITIRINRFNEDGTQYFNPEMTEEQRTHISECELDDYCCDWYINNDGTLDELQNTVNQLIREII